MMYKCPCGYIYDEDKEGIKYEELPDDYECPVCYLTKDAFKLIED